jgi:hypothetical protein
MEKTGPKSYWGYAWAEESLLPGGNSPLIISNDDDDDDDMVSISELFARTDPAPTAATTTAAPAAGTNISIPLLHLVYLALYEQQRVLKIFPSII